MNKNLTKYQLCFLKEDYGRLISLYGDLKRAKNNTQRKDISEQLINLKTNIITNYNLTRFDIHLNHYKYDDDYFKDEVADIISEQEGFNNTFFVTQIDELNWKGRLGDKTICRFQYFKDKNGVYWINNIGCKIHRNGFGTIMMQQALNVYNEVHVSTADESEVKAKRKKEDNDYRYVKEYNYEMSNLKKFIDYLIEQDILKYDWVRNPFENLL